MNAALGVRFLPDFLAAFFAVFLRAAGRLADLLDFLALFRLLDFFAVFFFAAAIAVLPDWVKAVRTRVKTAARRVPN